MILIVVAMGNIDIMCIRLSLLSKEYSVKHFVSNRYVTVWAIFLFCKCGVLHI